MISDEILRSIKQRLVDGFGPEKIILFGSQARGAADDRSDVDILVVCSFEGKRRQLMLEMDRALSGLDYAFDVLILRPEAAGSVLVAAARIPDRFSYSWNRRKVCQPGR